MNEIVDVLIIGAGASGSAVAWSLADTRCSLACGQDSSKQFHCFKHGYAGGGNRSIRSRIHQPARPVPASWTTSYAAACLRRHLRQPNSALERVKIRCLSGATHS
jgi:cation diffusion facilitator CzcD-associated flavoprotein CzcO